MANRIEFETLVRADGFRKGLAEMEAAANATNTRLQTMLQGKLASVNARMAGMDPNSWEYVQAAQRKARLERSLLTVQNAMYLREAQTRQGLREKELSEVRAADAARVASNRAALATIVAQEREAALAETVAMEAELGKRKAAEVASLLAVARGYGPGVSLGGGGHGGGGLSGIVREFLVIVRELSMGRGLGRVAGSVTLLAQYMGVLGKVIQSTAQKELEASDAASTLARSMAREALAARGSAEGEALHAAALEQKKIATEKATEAEIALANAEVKVTAAGWALFSVLATVGTLALVWYHFHKIAQEQRAFQLATDASAKTFSDEAKAARDDVRAHQELHRWLQNELSARRSLIDITDERIRQLNEEMEAQRELARARGESSTQINRLEIQQLQREQAILETAKATAEAKLKQAEAALATADKNLTDNPKLGDADLLGSKAARDAAAKMIDAIQRQMDANPALSALLGQKAAGRTTASSAAADLPFGANMSLATDIKSGAMLAGVNGMDIDAAIARVRQELSGESYSANGQRATYQQAQDAYQQNQKLINTLTQLQGTLADNVESAKRDVSSNLDALRSFTKRISDIQTDLKIKQGIGAQAAAAQDAKQFARAFGSGDALQRVGNFLGSARSGIHSLAEKHLVIAAQQLQVQRNIEHNTRRGAHGSGAGPQFSGS